MAYTDIDKPSDYFNTKLYTGNGSSGHAITGVGFQPDLVWIKPRDQAYNHRLFDVVRGAGKKISSDTNSAEATDTNEQTSFNSDGFTIGSDAGTNANTKTYASWNWLGSNTTATNTSGSINTTICVNQEAGFSITGWTHNGSNSTIGHGLNAVPKMIITKERNNVGSWAVYHVGSGNANRLVLQGTNANISTSIWNSTTPTSSVFSFNDSITSTMISYCFAEKQGYSKFESYTGNGNDNGVFIYTGFKPAFLIIKRTDSTNNWMMIDNKRGPFNFVDEFLVANDSAAESSNNIALGIDFLSNGFKIRDSDAAINASGGTYIYMAFAENPFVTSEGVPATAR